MRSQLLIPSLLATLYIPSLLPGQARDSLELFAPGVITTDEGESFATFSPDGREFYFTQHRKDWSAHRIMVSRFDGSRWSAPVMLPFSGTYNDREPKLSPDGRRLYFSSNRPLGSDTARRRDLDLWYVERGANSAWGTPQHLPAPINTDALEFCPVITANGTLYFISNRAGSIGRLNVWQARWQNGAWSAPVNIGSAVNTGTETNVYVTPDEQLMLLSRDGAPDGFGGDDLYMSRRTNSTWSTPVNLGAPINTNEYEYGPLLSPDRKWLYFTSGRRGTGDLYRIPFSLVQPQPQQAAERAAVRRAVLDYVEGFYEGDTAKIVRSVRPEAAKYGFFIPKDSTRYQGEAMTWQEMIDYAKRVKARNQPAPVTAPKQVDLLDVQDQTAAAKLTAWWGTDYLQLAKYDGRWMIVHVLWQSPPRK